jgi:hypothetical protein
MPYDGLLLPFLVIGLVAASERISPVIRARIVRYTPWAGGALAAANFIEGAKMYIWLLPLLAAALVWVGLQLMIRRISGQTHTEPSSEKALLPI